MRFFAQLGIQEQNSPTTTCFYLYSSNIGTGAEKTFWSQTLLLSVVQFD